MKTFARLMNARPQAADETRLFQIETKGIAMADFGNEAGLWAVRAAGACAGAAVSLVYLLPKSRREAAGRFFTGLTCGLIFGGPTGAWLIQRMALTTTMSPAETVLAGSAAASLGAWWALGILSRIAARYGAKSPD